MINIIQPGVVGVKTYLHHCPTCNCKFTYQQEDLILDQRDGDFVKCPTCASGLAHSVFLEVDPEAYGAFEIHASSKKQMFN
jgi:NAD-dependent SIR2 family protein deacetylase